MPTHQRFGDSFRAVYWTLPVSMGVFRNGAATTGPTDSEDHVVNLISQGAYLTRNASGTDLVDANRWAFFDRHRSYDITDLTPGERSGTYLRYHPILLRDMLDELSQPHAQAEHIRFGTTTAAIRTELLQRWHQMLAHPAKTAHHHENLLLLAHDILASALPHLPARKLSSRRVEAVRHVQQILSAELTTTHALQDLGGRVALSPYHLARGFRAATGDSVHQYRDRLRLHRAAARLRQKPDLTNLALELGYSSHSHFTARFRRYFGVTPSRFT